MWPKSIAAAVLAAVMCLDLFPVVAHPGEKHELGEMLKEASIRHAVADVNQDLLGRCNNHAEAQERRERAMKRRLASFQRLRAERGISDGKQGHGCLL